MRMMPRFNEVCGISLITGFMWVTPVGTAMIYDKIPSVFFLDTAAAFSASSQSAFQVMPGSVTSYSANSSSPAALKSPSIFSLSDSAGKRILASAPVGIALSASPPLMETRRKDSSAKTLYRALARRLLPFALPIWISEPECPPLRPDTLTFRTMPSLFLRFMGISQTTSEPPAQPAQNTPSSSESRFRSLRLLRPERSMADAPTRPTSSSDVKMHSIRGCLMLSSARTASIMATAMPLSAPRVVPSAVIQPSSSRIVTGSVSMSICLSGSLARTISMCP